MRPSANHTSGIISLHRGSAGALQTFVFAERLAVDVGSETREELFINTKNSLMLSVSAVPLGPSAQ